MKKYVDREPTLMARNDTPKFNPDYEGSVYDEQRAFKKGVFERIVELGYTGDEDDTDEIVEFVCAKFQEHGIQLKGKEKDLTKVNVTNWLTGGAPNDSNQSRPNVYKLCFALEMNAIKTGEFFLKNYLCRPFNFKKAEEAVYYFCLNTGRSYQDAEELIRKVNNMPKSKVAEDVETRLMEVPLSEYKNEEDFLDYMETHRYNKSEYKSTAIKEIDFLFTRCKELSGAKSRRELLELIYGFNEEVITVYDEESDRDKIFGITKSKLPDAVTRNFPRKQCFTRIYANTASDDVCRKMLLMLFFFKFYTEVKPYEIKNRTKSRDMDLGIFVDEFEVALDQLLEKCGYVQVYWKNPFDRFILLCAKAKDPIKELRYLLEKYYLYADEDEEYDELE